MPFMPGAGSSGSSSVIFLDEGTAQGTAAGTAIINAVGTGIGLTYSGGTATLTSNGVIVQDEGTAQGTGVILNFVGAGVSAAYSSGTATVTIAGGTAAGSIITQDEGSTIGTATVLNFVGSGGTAAYSGGTTTVTISSGISSGTAFPGSPANNDLYYRTDLDLIFFYDSTRWLTTTVFVADLQIWAGTHAANISATTVSYAKGWVPPLVGCSDIYVLEFFSRTHINTGTALSGSHKWVGTLNKLDSANASVTIGTINFDSGSDNIWRNGSNTVNALLFNGTTRYAMTVDWTKTGTPGDVQTFDGWTYRLVAT